MWESQFLQIGQIMTNAVLCEIYINTCLSQYNQPSWPHKSKKTIGQKHKTLTTLFSQEKIFLHMSALQVVALLLQESAKSY